MFTDEAALFTAWMLQHSSLTIKNTRLFFKRMNGRVGIKPRNLFPRNIERFHFLYFYKSNHKCLNIFIFCKFMLIEISCIQEYIKIVGLKLLLKCSNKISECSRLNRQTVVPIYFESCMHFLSKKLIHIL